MKTGKPERSKRECCFALLAASLVGWTLAAEAYTAYLPTVGPAALRFRPDYKPAVHIKPAPLSTADQPPAPVPAPVAPVLTAPAPAPQTNIVIVAQSPPPAPAPEQPRPDGAVSPQMLLKYFNRPTNAPDANAALGFTPPPQPDQPSSRATYSNPAH